MQDAAKFNPINWGVVSAREVVRGTYWGSAGLRLGLLFALSVATAAFATWTFRSYQRTIQTRAARPRRGRSRLASPSDTKEEAMDEERTTLSDEEMTTTGTSTRSEMPGDTDSTDADQDDTDADTDSTDADSDSVDPS
jgi:hypothetical protein